MRSEVRGATIGFGLLALIGAAVCGRFGFWQLDRLEQRRALNAVIEARLQLPPISVARTGEMADPLAYQRVSAAGIYDADRTIVEVFRSRNGVPGVYVVSPLMLNDSTAVLVERGWAAAPDARTVDVERFTQVDSVTVDGYLHPVTGIDSIRSTDPSWPRFVRSADPITLGELFPYQLLPVLVRRTGGADTDQLAVLKVPAMDEGSHLSYAVQWFSFAVIAVVGGFIWIRLQIKETTART